MMLYLKVFCVLQNCFKGGRGEQGLYLTLLCIHRYLYGERLKVFSVRLWEVEECAVSVCEYERVSERVCVCSTAHCWPCCTFSFSFFPPKPFFTPSYLPLTWEPDVISSDWLGPSVLPPTLMSSVPSSPLPSGCENLKLQKLSVYL